MRDGKSYVPPFQIGETMDGGAIGQVVASEFEGLSEGDYILSSFGWREAFRCAGDRVKPLGELEAPPSAYLGVMGMPGMTAYTGLLGAASLQEGETVFVSGAAGAVGSAVGQIAKIKGCRVIGCAGSAARGLGRRRAERRRAHAAGWLGEARVEQVPGQVLLLPGYRNISTRRLNIRIIDF